METGSKTKDLVTGAWYTSTQYYDYLGRLIQEHIGNPAGADEANMNYRYDGALLNTSYTHNNINTKNTISYDPQGRPLALEHTLNGTAKTLATYEYDEIGRLIQKNVAPGTATYGTSQTSSIKSGIWQSPQSWNTGNEPCSTDQVTINTNHSINIPANTQVYTGSVTVNGNLKIEPNAQLIVAQNLPNSLSLTALQKIQYSYNVRSWLTGINTNASTTEADLFSQTFTYNADGNIANTTTWASPTNKCNGSLQSRSYAYSYDQAQRLTAASYTGQGDYSLPAIAYTKNGNIIKLERNGQKQDGTYRLIDNLSYNYTGNQVQSITDAVGKPIP